MTRITHVKSARKDAGECGCCRAKIKKGQGYYWLAFRFGGRRVRCEEPACRFKRSDTTQSKLSTVYAAQEVAEQALSKWDRLDHEALQEIVTSAGETVREVLDEYESAADEHPNLAGQTEDIRSELGSIADDLEGFDVDEWDKSRETQDVWATRVLGEAGAVIDRISEV
jgi:hypothetical protein